MLNKLIEALLEIREKYNDEEHNFVILMRPDIFFKIKEELGGDESIKTIAGCNVSIVVQSDVPEDITFFVFTQKDYERMAEQEIRQKMITDILKKWEIKGE